MTDDERDQQIDTLMFILGSVIGALERLGHLQHAEARKMIRIANHEEPGTKEAEAS